MAKPLLLSPKRPVPWRHAVEDQPESQHQADSASSCSSFNPVSLMLGAFSTMTEDVDFVNFISVDSSNTLADIAGAEDNTDSSFSASFEKHQSTKSRSMPPSPPGTPLTAASTTLLSPSTSASSSSLGFSSSDSGHKRNAWKWARHASSGGDSEETHPRTGSNGRWLKLTPHIWKGLEIAPLVDESTSNSSEDEMSTSRELVVASVALEITGNFVDSLMERITAEPDEDDIHHNENHCEADHEPPIPREIVLLGHLFTKNGQQRNDFTRLPRGDEYFTLPEDDDDELLEISPRRARTHSEEYEVVSL